MARMMSACGVWCSDCPAYLADEKGHTHQKRTTEAWRRIYRLNVQPENIACGGCLGPDEALFTTSLKCTARRCCQGHGYSSCAECRVPACADLEHAQSVWDGVPRLAARLSAADFTRYAQPYCGHRARLAAVRARRRARAARNR